MVIGVCKIALYMDEVFSLKEKRHIVKSLVERIKARFNVSIAEVEQQDVWNNAVIGIVCVSNDAAHADSMMGKVVNFVEENRNVVMEDYSTELIYVD